MRHSLFCLAITLFSLLAASQPAIAQNNFFKNLAKPSAWGASTKPVPLQSSRLTQAVEFPDLPPYSGPHKFLSGDCAPLKSGNSYNVCFSANETRKQILDWYETALKNNNWNNVTRTAHYVGAKKKNNSCHVTVSQAKFTKTRSLITISYYADNNNH